MEQITKDIEKMKYDIEIIKNLLLPKMDDEGELSDWAKEELEKARDESEEECISLEEARNIIENKK